MTPAPREPLPVLGLGLHHAPASTTTRARRAGQQPVGQALRRERGFVDACGRRVELGRLDQIGRRRCQWSRRCSSTPASQPVGLHARVPKRGRAPPGRAARRTRRACVTPSRPRRSASAHQRRLGVGRVSACTGHGARNAGVASAFDDARVDPRSAARAASRAANAPSAIPTRASTHPRSRATVRATSAARARRHHRSSATARVSGNEHTPGRSSTTRGASLLDRARDHFERARVGRGVGRPPP